MRVWTGCVHFTPPRLLRIMTRSNKRPPSLLATFSIQKRCLAMKRDWSGKFLKTVHSNLSLLVINYNRFINKFVEKEDSSMVYFSCPQNKYKIQTIFNKSKSISNKIEERRFL